MSETDASTGFEEIERDKAVEWRLLWKALAALAIVAAFVVVRTIIVG